MTDSMTKKVEKLAERDKAKNGVNLRNRKICLIRKTKNTMSKRKDTNKMDPHTGPSRRFSWDRIYK